MTSRRNVLALAIALAAALIAAPAPAHAADGQIDVSVPTKVPCYVSAKGVVTTPSNWEIRNNGSEEVSLGDVTVEPGSDASATISASSSVGGAEKTSWFSYANDNLTQNKTGEELAAGASASVDWTVDNLGHDALEGAANGEFTLASVTFTFVQKPRAFAVLFTGGTAKLYKRACALPAVGDTFDGGTVSYVVDGIEDRSSIFNNVRTVNSVTVVDEGIRPVKTDQWFFNCLRLQTANLSRLDFSLDKDMSGMFSGCRMLSSLDVSKWDTSKVTSTVSMFGSCSSLYSLDVSKWDTSKVTSMDYMFDGCSSLSSLDVSKWDTSKVTSTNYMFDGCSSLSSLDVSKWDTSKVTSMGYMFGGCSSLRSLTVGTGFTLDLTKTSFPVSTLYTTDGTPVALADIPKNTAATYYTKAEYVPQQPAGDEPAADQGSAVQNADAAANAVANDAPDAGATDADGSPASDGSASGGDPAPSADSAPAAQLDAVQDDPTSPLSDTQPEFSLAA